METHIKGKGVGITTEVQAYFERRAERIAKLVHEPLARLEVELERLGDHKTEAVFRSELMLRGPGLAVRAESSHASLHGAIDESTDELVQELRKSKGKRIDMVRRQALRFKNYLRGWYE